MENEVAKIKRSLVHTKIAVTVLSCALFIVALKLVYLETNFNDVVASLAKLVEHLNDFINVGLQL